jgi:hypothetical protein
VKRQTRFGKGFYLVVTLSSPEGIYFSTWRATADDSMVKKESMALATVTAIARP